MTHYSRKLGRGLCVIGEHPCGGRDVLVAKHTRRAVSFRASQRSDAKEHRRCFPARLRPFLVAAVGWRREALDR